MGVGELLQNLGAAMVPVNWNLLVGKTAAIDVSCWLYKILHTSNNTEEMASYVFRKLDLLQKRGITVIVVFDGLAPEAKNETREKRDSVREKAREKAKRLKLDGQTEAARKASLQAKKLEPAYVTKIKERCILEDIQFVEAPFEADAQLAYLMRIGMADFVITEDSDLILHNCSQIVYKFGTPKEEMYVQARILENCWGAPFNLECLTAVCIASGCDYGGKVEGFGPVKAKNLYPDLAPNFSFTRFVNLLKKTSGVTVPDDFKVSFWRAMHTFKHQLVFDPRTSQIVPVTPYRAGKSHLDYPFAGKMDQAKGNYWRPDVPVEPKPVLVAQNANSIQLDSVCKNCKKSFPSFKLLSNHFEKEHSLKCPKCPNEYKTYRGYLQHQRNQHPKGERVLCEICGHDFKCGADLSTHRAKVHPNDDGEATCKLCGKKLRTSQALKTHIHRVHSSGDPLKCPKCGKVFKYQLSVKQHMRYKHAPEDSVQCPECPKVFKTKMGLNQHLKNVHSKDDPIDCPISDCPKKGFKSLSHVRKHLRRGHKLEGPLPI